MLVTSIFTLSQNVFKSFLSQGCLRSGLCDKESISSYMFQELEKAGLDLEDITTQLDESSKQNQRLQRELENVHDLHRKVSFVH